ncbi:MAG TPA: SAVED domain-containing protein, partial [Thermoanaerobaculia bacterium]|nr:SAVED domain-containing protein [Thermoanaerobaculia bacterium]
RFLPLEDFFQDRFIRNPEDWGDRLLPRLEDFLTDAVHQRRPLTLCLAAHATLAFATGYFFHTKEEAPLTLLQMTGGRAFRWSAGVGSVPDGPLWQDFVEVPLDPDARDVAVAVEITQPTSTAVEAYLKKSGMSVGRLVRARIAGEPGKARVESGAHAFQMASQLHQWLKDHTGDLGRRRLHLFIAAPNGFVFFLGQLARSLGPLSLYEYDLEILKHGTYERSLELKRLVGE